MRFSGGGPTKNKWLTVLGRTPSSTTKTNRLSVIRSCTYWRALKSSILRSIVPFTSSSDILGDTSRWIAINSAGEGRKWPTTTHSLTKSLLVSVIFASMALKNKKIKFLMTLQMQANEPSINAICFEAFDPVVVPTTEAVRPIKLLFEQVASM